MFLEYKADEKRKRGWIEVICGSMFSGKTEELIRRLKRAKFAKQTVEIFKPEIDVRYNEEEVVSHDQNAIPSTPVSSSTSILLLADQCDVIGIDEAQFFDSELPHVCNKLANRGIRVIVAGFGYGFQRDSIRAHSRIIGHCRVCDQGACHMCAMREFSAVLLSKSSK
jgi:thymidine kinase